MGYFEDQQEAWYHSNCQGLIENQEPYVDAREYEEDTTECETDEWPEIIY